MKKKDRGRREDENKGGKKRRWREIRRETRIWKEGEMERKEEGRGITK